MPSVMSGLSLEAIPLRFDRPSSSVVGSSMIHRGRPRPIGKCTLPLVIAARIGGCRALANAGRCIGPCARISAREQAVWMPASAPLGETLSLSLGSPINDRAVESNSSRDPDQLEVRDRPCAMHRRQSDRR
jgi:hypothetical protein